MTRLVSSALVLIALLTFAGCDSNDPEPRTEAFSFTLDFDLRDAERVGAVASQGYARLDIPPSVVENGAVLAYYRDQRTWTALPLTLGLEKVDEPVVDYTVTFGYAFDVDFVELFLEASTDDDVVWEEIAQIFGGGLLVKIVVIDSYLAVDRRIDAADHDAVMRHLGLAE